LVLSNHQTAESMQVQASTQKHSMISQSRTLTEGPVADKPAKNASDFIEQFLERIEKTGKKSDGMPQKSAKKTSGKTSLKHRIDPSQKGKSVNGAAASLIIKSKDSKLKPGVDSKNPLLDDQSLFDFFDDSAAIPADIAHLMPAKAALSAGSALPAAEAGNRAIGAEKLLSEVNGKKGKSFAIRRISLKKVSSDSRIRIDSETANKAEYKSGTKLELSEDTNHGNARRESAEASRSFIIDTRTSAERNGAVVAEEAIKRTQNAEVQELESTDSRIRTFAFETKDLSNVLRNSDSPVSNARSTISFPASIREPLNSEIVKQTGIILKSGDSGEIRLVLEPKQLGKVRIRIQLQQNRIAGRIIVDNINIKEAFEHDLEELQRAFRENGFEVGNFDVAVGGQGQRENGFSRKDTSTANMMHVKELDDAVPLIQQVYRAESLVDLVV
jgi:flagellar hook-length control protein FliK